MVGEYSTKRYTKNQEIYQMAAASEAARRWLEENKALSESAGLRLVRCDAEEMIVSVKGKGVHVPLAMSEGQLFMAYMDFNDNNAGSEMAAELFESKLERVSEALQKIEVRSREDGLRKIPKVLSEFAERFGYGDVGKAAKKKKSSAVLASASERHQMQTVMKEFKAMSEGIESATAKDFLRNITLDMPSETDISRWHVKMGMEMFREKKDLYKDLMVRFPREGGHVLLEITFTKTFPFEPPFVRVVRPRFAFHTGHVTVGGSICMELLTPQGWTPAFSLEAVLVLIHNAILDGGARIDLNNHTDYSFSEAKSAFYRVARNHQWIPKNYVMPESSD